MQNTTITTDGNTLFFNKDINCNSINLTEDIYINNALYVPVGSIITYAGSSSPSGWLVCDGSEVSKNNYNRLYSVIGNTYGSPSDPNNFNLPNLTNRVPVGKTIGTALGDLGGNNSITISTLQLPSHTHTGTTNNSDSHVHTGTTDNNGSHTHGVTDPGHTHTQTTVNDDFNNSGGSPPGFTADGAGSRTWSNINSSTTGISINSNGTHGHTFTTASGGIHNHTFTTDTTGSGNSIDIRNNYLILNYIIRY